MARILFLAFSGGGNLHPSLGIAHELTTRGHEVAFAGNPEMMPHKAQTRFRSIELTRAYAQLDNYPDDPQFGRWFCGLTSPAVEAQARSIVDAENPDFILVDFTFLAALNLRLSQRSAAIAHMTFFRVADIFRQLTRVCSGIRQRAGFPALPEFDDLLSSRDRVIVTSLGAIDPAPSDAPLAQIVRHVGPALSTEAHARPLKLHWNWKDPTSLVLVSFSTDPLQVSPDLIQRSLDALGQLDVHVVATVSASVDIRKLSCPPNALIVEAADHDLLMAKAALVVNHGGHGAVMRALKHGVPMIVLPGIAPDQASNGKMVEELGAGRVLTQDASSHAIGALARELLAISGYRGRAKEVSKLFSDVDGAVGAADEIESLLARAGSQLEAPAPLRKHG